MSGKVTTANTPIAEFMALFLNLIIFLPSLLFRLFGYTPVLDIVRE